MDNFDIVVAYTCFFYLRLLKLRKWYFAKNSVAFYNPLENILTLVCCVPPVILTSCHNDWWHECHFCQAALNLWSCQSHFFDSLMTNLSCRGHRVDFHFSLILFYSCSCCSVALTVPIRRTNECARFTQVVCEPVPIFFQHSCWMAGQMAPNDVTSCFNKTLEGSAASLNTNKDYYAIHFLPPLSNFLSLFFSLCHFQSNSFSLFN